MKSKNLSIGLFILILASCNGGRGNKDQAPASNADTTAAIPSPTAVKTCDTTIIPDIAYVVRNDQVLSAALETVLSCRSLDRAFREAMKSSKTSPNKYDQKNVDTTVIYTVDCDSVTYLGSKANCFPLRLTIQSQRLSFDSGYIRIRMTKNKFVERYQLKKDVPDVITMSDLERSNELVFFFSDGVLRKVIYNSLYAE